MKFEIIKRSILWIILAIVLAGSGIYLFLTNITLSIQFTGGMEVQLKTDTDQELLKNSLITHLQEKNYSDFDIGVGIKDGNTDILLKIPVSDDSMVADMSDDVQGFLIDNGHVKSDNDILEVSIIGPSVGEYMKQSAIKAIVFGLILMGIYILFAFSGMRLFINPALLAIVTIITMFFDIAIPSGAYGLLMSVNSTVQVDSIFIIALLTIMGYSINDTIIVFDRIRENFQLHEGKVKDGRITYKSIFETSLWQTMKRSIGTSFSTLLVIIAMYIFGTGILKSFAFTVGIGIVAGTYSSIFIAAPLAYVFCGKYKKEKSIDSKKINK